MGSEGHAQGQCRRGPGVGSRDGFCCGGPHQLDKDVQNGRKQMILDMMFINFFFVCWVVFEIIHVKRITH